MVIIGNDQREFFNAGLTPAITVYRGTPISNVQHLNEDAPGLNIAEPANSPEEGATYPGATELADHILRFARRRELRSGAVGPDAQRRAARRHPARLRLLLPHDPAGPDAAERADHPERPLPAQHAEAARCLELGRGLHRAITSFDGFKRVAFMASGGLTHFVIDEDFDRTVIAAMRAATRTPWPSCRRATSRSARPRSRTGTR